MTGAEKKIPKSRIENFSAKLLYLFKNVAIDRSALGHFTEEGKKISKFNSDQNIKIIAILHM